MELTIKVICKDLPGKELRDAAGEICHANVYLGIQHGEQVIEMVPGDSKTAEFAPVFRVAPLDDGQTNFLGPFAKGTKTERFFYLSWGDLGEDGIFRMFRRAKIHLSQLPWKTVERAAGAGKPIVAHLSLTDKRGGPLCASVKPPYIKWESNN